MTNADAIRTAARCALNVLSSDESMAKVLREISRSPLNDGGQMYSLWCDNQGNCKDKHYEDIEDVCSEEAHIACILRFLRRERKE